MIEECIFPPASPLEEKKEQYKLPPTAPLEEKKERRLISLICRNPMYREGVLRVLSEGGNYDFDKSKASLDILVMDLEVSVPAYRPTVGRPVLLISSDYSAPLPTLRTGSRISHLPYCATPNQLRQAVRGLLDGPEQQTFSSPAPQEQLSPRERQALKLISLGRTHEQVARHMGISRHTVDTYVKRARKKFKIGNKAELTRIVMSYD